LNRKYIYYRFSSFSHFTAEIPSIFDRRCVPKHPLPPSLALPLHPLPPSLALPPHPLPPSLALPPHPLSPSLALPPHPLPPSLARPLLSSPSNCPFLVLEQGTSGSFVISNWIEGSKYDARIRDIGSALLDRKATQSKDI
jgi:hypothetical protein